MSVYPGNILTATAATVNASPTSTRTWQWFRSGTAIPAATASGYVVTTEDIDALLTVKQGESNFLGITSATSAGVGPVETYSPAMLFALNEPGVWFDPSDLTTLFQDDAGTTPVTTPSQTVGLMLDKSRNGVGTNGASRRNLLSFSEQFNAGVWFVFGGGSVTGTNVATAPDGTTTADSVRVTTAGTGSNIYQQPTYTVAAVPYTFSCYVKRNAASDQTFQLFNNLQGAQSSSGNLVATDTWQRFSHTSTSAAGSGAMLVGIIGNTSGVTADLLVWGAQLEVGSTATAYQPITASWAATIPGNHAVQATFANRPLYGIVPFGGRRNILTFSQDFENAAWLKDTATVSANTTVAPDGTMTADTLTGVSGLFRAYQIIVPILNGVPYTLSAYVKQGTSPTIGFDFINVASGPTFTFATASWSSVAGFTTTVQDVGNGWYRISAAAVSNTTNGGPGWRVSGTTTAFIWGAQMEQSATATPYQRVTTQYDVTEAGVQSCSYLFFDGADSMSTSTITPGTDKAQVFAGVRKLVDAASIIVEFGTASSSLGAFFLNTEVINTPYGFSPRGARAADANDIALVTGFVAPDSAVLTAKVDLSDGQPAQLRRNAGAYASSVNTTFGTGNFLAHSLYIGARSGGLFPFNGNLFSLITRFGANLDTTTINATEAWVADKTGINIANNTSATIFARDDTAVLDRFNQIIERRA